MKQEIELYKASDGHLSMDVHLVDDTVWLSLNQMATLFEKDKSVISRHINNIFKINELERGSVVAKFATTASDGKTYQVDYYNLDMIISVGYRVNSKKGIHFRQWATQVLKDHLVKGYTIHKNRIAECGLDEMTQAIELLQKTLVNHELISDLGQEAMQLILSYAKTWHVLLAYDEGNLKQPKRTQKVKAVLTYKDAVEAINALRVNLNAQKEATSLFGQERDQAFESILCNIEQTFDGMALYKTSQERAAHLLYFIIKDHPFVDGNKRIGSFMFLLYLRTQKLTIKLNENGLIALALLVAESDPKQKEMIILLIMNLI